MKYNNLIKCIMNNYERLEGMDMKEKLIQEISTAMAEVLSFEQVAHLNRDRKSVV